MVPSASGRASQAARAALSLRQAHSESGERCRAIEPMRRQSASRRSQLPSPPASFICWGRQLAGTSSRGPLAERDHKFVARRRPSGNRHASPAAAPCRRLAHDCQRNTWPARVGAAAERHGRPCVTGAEMVAYRFDLTIIAAGGPSRWAHVDGHGQPSIDE